MAIRDASRPSDGVDAAASEMWCQVREYASPVWRKKGGDEKSGVQRECTGGGGLLCQWFVTLEWERLPPGTDGWLFLEASRRYDS